MKVSDEFKLITVIKQSKGDDLMQYSLLIIGGKAVVIFPLLSSDICNNTSSRIRGYFGTGSLG